MNFSIIFFKILKNGENFCEFWKNFCKKITYHTRIFKQLQLQLKYNSFTIRVINFLFGISILNLNLVNGIFQKCKKILKVFKHIQKN